MPAFLKRFLPAPLFLACVLAGCGGGKGGRIFVLGLDGMDPVAVDLLMAEGKLPHFAALRQHGAYARLESQKPLLSPVIWTTIATGKTPDRHGIGHFVALDPQSGEELPVTSSLRRVKALWTIASQQGKRVEVVGWWATWPAEAVRGSIVSDHAAYHFLLEKPGGGTRIANVESAKVESTQVTHPAELLAQVRPLLVPAETLRYETAAPFVDVSREEFARPFSFDDDLSHFKWALGTAIGYRDVALKLWREEHPDFAALYIEATDSTAHLFGHLFRAPPLSGELAGQQRKFGHAVERMYVFADEILGQVMDALDRDTTLVVLSDHGFRLGELQEDPSATRDMRRVSERFHREQGILYLYGRNVREGARLNAPGILDIAPTVLTLLGLQPAQDMPGRVLTEGLISVPAGAAAERIATYESGSPSRAPQAARAGGAGSLKENEESHRSDQNEDSEALREHLKSLGYLHDDQVDLQARSSFQGERNLAAIAFEQRRYAEAERMYRALAEKDPKDGSLRTSLAGALGALGRYAEARSELEAALKLDPVNPEGHHNLAVLYERAGERERAIDEYRTALRYAPQYEPSRQALLRLTGSAEVAVPRGEEERKAGELAARASELAKRGDYPGAMHLLDEAEGLAPRYVLVYQYRSNVAYLMGDRKAAIAALKKALEIEPGNALFQANLKRLESAGPKR